MAPASLYEAFFRLEPNVNAQAHVWILFTLKRYLSCCETVEKAKRRDAGSLKTPNDKNYDARENFHSYVFPVLIYCVIDENKLISDGCPWTVDTMKSCIFTWNFKIWHFFPFKVELGAAIELGTPSPAFWFCHMEQTVLFMLLPGLSFSFFLVF